MADSTYECRKCGRPFQVKEGDKEGAMPALRQQRRDSTTGQTDDGAVLRDGGRPFSMKVIQEWRGHFRN